MNSGCAMMRNQPQSITWLRLGLTRSSMSPSLGPTKSAHLVARLTAHRDARESFFRAVVCGGDGIVEQGGP